jgi:hypothetical protein
VSPIEAVIATGLPCFPCSRNKRPAIPGPGGHKHATSDPAALRALWRRYPGPLVGVRTGDASGLFVLDIDGAKHLEAKVWWVAQREWLPTTRIHQTQSDGLHLVFWHVPGVRASQDREGRPAKGGDTRGDGGYVIWWPAAGYPVLCDAPAVPPEAARFQVDAQGQSARLRRNSTTQWADHQRRRDRRERRWPVGFIAVEATIYRDGNIIRDPNNEIRYAPVCKRARAVLRNEFSERLDALIKAEYPTAVDGATNDAERIDFERIEVWQSLAVILTALPAMPQHELYWALRGVETQCRSRLLLSEDDPARNRRKADMLPAVADKIRPRGEIRR